MNYPYYDELARHLESNPEDMTSCSTSNVYQNTGHTSGERDATHVYQNVVPISGEHILHNATKNIFSGSPKHSVEIFSCVLIFLKKRVLYTLFAVCMCFIFVLYRMNVK